MANSVPTSFDSPTVASKNLSRLLSRLDQKLRSGGNSTTPLERAKIAANLEYSRQLLHNLESASATITVPARRQKSLAELGTQKQTIRRLNESLQLAASNTTEGEVTSEGEDEEDDGALVPVDGGGGLEDDDDDDYASLKKPKPTRRRLVASPSQRPLQADTQTPLQEDTQTASTVRHRFPTKSTIEQKQELFGASASGAKKVTSTTAVPESSGTEALLDYQRSEQESITSDLLSMAKMLKESSLEFGKNLEDEKSYLQAAREGLGRNAQGMQVAGQKMETLRRDENVSFIWSMIYLAIIVALALLTLFILFFAPKLRWW